MGIVQLLRWQWAGYPKYHQSRPNLLIHIVAVPLFLVGTVAFVAAVSELSLLLLAVAAGCILVAVVLQGRGHRLEPVPPEPFSGPMNFISRIFLEQWVTFHGLFSQGVGLQHCARHASPNPALRGRPVGSASRRPAGRRLTGTLGLVLYDFGSLWSQ